MSYNKTMKNYVNDKKGFTVLEFLVVIAMMGILISLVLVGLSRARSQSRDQGKVSEIQKIAIGLEQYYDICGEYPENLTGSEACPALSNQTPSRSIGDILPEVASMDFNASGSPYFYSGLSQSQNPSQCSGFHAGVLLEGSASGFNRSAKSSLSDTCSSVTPGFDAVNNQNIFDIHKLP
jgi:prepilin-type N-terminal cleavage/methylation domain-containing protein